MVCLILLAAGVLAEMPRGVDAPTWREQSGKTTMTANADDLTVDLSIKPAMVGQNTFDVYLSDAAGVPVNETRAVSLRFAFDEASSRLEEPGTPATFKGDGHYVLEGNYISVVGTWTIEVAIRRPQRYDAFATYRALVGPNGNISAHTNASPWVDPWEQRLTWLGRAITGALLVLLALGWGPLAIRAANGRWQTVAFSLLALGLLGFGAHGIYTFFTGAYTPMKFTPNPHLANADSVELGQPLYEQHCQPCHGLAGQGRGHLSNKLRQPARPFLVSLTSAHSDGDVFYRIQHGVKGTAMPAYAGFLSADDTWHVVNYVRRLMGSR